MFKWQTSIVVIIAFACTVYIKVHLWLCIKTNKNVIFCSFSQIQLRIALLRARDICIVSGPAKVYTDE